MTGRIEWSRYEGDDVESVIAMMINREHPNSVRIRPSRGDGGIDVLDRGAGPEGGDVVYQIKKYSGPLTQGQKTKIKASLETLLHPKKRDARWKHLRVTQWRLVLPYDPTPEIYNWFHETLVADYTVQAVWDGLVVVDELAAKYDDVIDYYLRDGKSAVLQAMTELMSLYSTNSTSDGVPTANEVANRFNAARAVLDHDPHYKYELHFGHAEPPPPSERPCLAMSATRTHPSEQTWQRIDVIARCAHSQHERPITVSGKLEVETGSEDARSVQEFFDYGTPVVSPVGKYTGSITAPGGLGGPLVDASISIISPVDTEPGADRRLRLEILDDSEAVLATAQVDRKETSTGNAGLRAVHYEVNGVFVLTTLFDLNNSETTMTISSELPVGMPVAAVQGAIEFVSMFRYPFKLRTSSGHAPAELGVTTPIPRQDENDEAIKGMELQARVLKLLSKLQKYSAQPIKMPDPETISKSMSAWELAVRVAEGETAVAILKEGWAFTLDFGDTPEFPTGTFTVEQPNRVSVGTTTVDLGRMFATYEDPVELEGRGSSGSDGTHSFTTRNRRVSYSSEPPNLR